jgi:DNA-binding winged helix-turn-helix (wHTH) protein
VTFGVTEYFRWIAAAPIPGACDLRAAGWILRTEGSWLDDPVAPLLLAIPRQISLRNWLALARARGDLRARMVLWGVECSAERERLLRLGFGDVLDEQVGRGELATRAGRIAALRSQVPRELRIGAVRLDLVDRQAWCQGRSLGLHPREFALLWRLGEAAGLPVSQGRLLHDVWHLAFRPETNTVAVHVSRLRAKLRLAGCDGLVETLSWGGYRLARDVSVSRPLVPLHLPLDAPPGLGEAGRRTTRELVDAGGFQG